MSKLIELGIEKGHIALDADQKNILYTTQGKRLHYSDPEEKVRANDYLSLAPDYDNLAEQFGIQFTVPHRLNIYTDKTKKAPLIVVECKREEAREGELEQGIGQGFGYANSLKAKYLRYGLLLAY